MEVRDRILLKANELFNRFGFRRVTMDEIALKTGMSKKTIYQSFENKDEMVNAILEMHINKSIALCEINKQKSENAVHEFFLNMEMIQQLASEIHPSLFEDLEKFFPAVFEKFYKHKNNFIFKKVQDNLKRGMDEGVYRDDLDIDVMTRLRIETMFLPFNQQVFPFGKYNLAEVEVEIIEHFLYGLTSPKGQKLIKKYKTKRLKKQMI